MVDCFNDDCAKVFPTFNAASQVHAASSSDITTLRTALLAWLYPGTSAIPTRSVDAVTSSVTGPAGVSTNLLRCDKLRVDMTNTFKSYAYLYLPTARAGGGVLNKLAICHHGHEAGGYGVEALIQTAVTNGLAALEIFMPGYGDNTGAFSDHGDIGANYAGNVAFSYFVEPVFVCLTYCLATYSYSDVGMCGVSGGGWTTLLASAMDPRIRVAYPVSGTCPRLLRGSPCSPSEDWEQQNIAGSPLYGDHVATPAADKIGYLDLCLMAACPARVCVECLNQTDTVIAFGIFHRAYAAWMAKRALQCGGKFDVHEFTYDGHTLDSTSRDAFLAELTRQQVAPRAAFARR